MGIVRREYRGEEKNARVSVWNISYAFPLPFFKPRKILLEILLTQFNMPPFNLIWPLYLIWKDAILNYFINIWPPPTLSTKKLSIGLHVMHNNVSFYDFFIHLTISSQILYLYRKIGIQARA